MEGRAASRVTIYEANDVSLTTILWPVAKPRALSQSRERTSVSEVVQAHVVVP